ncbi:hypothetical protein L1276_002633 [Flavobacterium sp. HSC-32F16]|uniref:hypothetical protein n=1 Tax=Flavobacterium sp. HSC-32F16 TaxID=2910964 RepID=UPI0020A4FCFD|nr:hypothetical protein [Flavobacterium sp. HSC-32F16]MCP2027476.1 hypothetical protein [Flavobacterium sp. HSC-32F16]
MSTTPTEYKYYPALSDIMKPEDLPDFLSFIKDGLQSVFDKMYYKDYQTSKSTSGSSAFYSLDIISRKKLALELPGTGVFFVLNPDYEDSKISSFPVTVFWEWEVMRYLKYFNNNSFSFSVEDFYDLALTVLNISEEQIIQLAINTFVVQSSPALSKFGQLVQDINRLYSTTIAIDESSENKLQELIVQINLLDKKVAPAIFSLYLLSTDLSETKAKIKTFFSSFIPNDIEEYIKKIITPKARVTLELAAAIEFPRKMLVPWKNDGKERDEDETHIARFQFAKALLYADTQEGMGYNLELAGTLSPKYCEIGKTGMLIQIENLKLDLSKKTNIPEATTDGRPNDFVGVYARAVSVTLPSKWFHDYTKEGQGSTSTTLRIGASDLLIGTGGISGDIYLETVPVPTGVFSYFGDKFDFQYPLSMLQRNEETDVVEITQIADYNELLDYLQEFSASSTLPYPFSYPLTLTTKSTLVSSEVSPSTIYTFKNAKEYQAFLSKLAPDNTLWKKIGNPNRGFEIGFNKFDISFKQNKVIGSNIKGQLIINKLKNPDGSSFHATLEGHLYDDGDFNLTASFDKASEPKANLFGLVDFDFHSFELGKQDDDYYVGTSCYVSFPQGTLMNKLAKGQGFDVEKLRIYSDGNIEVEGGSIPIPINLSVNLGPVQMAVSNINFGSTQLNGRKYNFWGFDGAISVNPLGLDARGEGIKYYYSTEEGFKDSFIRIQTIEVDLMIPGTASEESAMAIIHGMISLPQPGESQEFMGEVSLKLPKAKITGSVGMRFAPKYPAFLVDAGIELPTGIPLGFLSITGFRGLLGFRYVATKKAAGLTTENSWYEFYKHPKAGINIRKFSGPPDSMQYKSPFSIGAGATFESTGGTILNMRAMLLLSLPTLFYIEAGLNVLGDRLGPIEKDQSTPPFFAMVAFGDNSLELAAGADFQMPKDGGQIIQLHALLEAGFFFKNQKPWYINLGSKKDPITARILTLFTAKAFIMLSAQGIEAGARLDFKLQKSFGPAKVKLWAYLEMGGKISFKRPQMGGYIAAGGGIQIKIWIINVEIVLDTIFSVESFKPFLIYAKLELSVRVKLGFVRVRKNFKIELQWDINRIVDRTPYSPLPKGTFGDANDNRTADSVKGVHMLTNEAFLLDYFDQMPSPTAISKVIPLDTFIDIKMTKGVLPNTSLSKIIGGYTADAKNYTDLMPPEATSKAGRKLRQVKHQYSIESIELLSAYGNTWEAYHPFKAVVDSTSRDLVKDLPWAQWQKVIDQYDSIRVLATNPFSYLSAGEPGWHVPEQFGITPSKLFCVSDSIEAEYVNFKNKKIGKRYYVPTQYEADRINGLFFKLVGETPEIVDGKLSEGDFMNISAESNPFGFRRSLSFKNYNKLEIIFPESAIEPTLKLTTQAKTVNIRAYTSFFEEGDKLSKYKEVKICKAKNSPALYEIAYTKAELRAPITLFDENGDILSKNKIDRIVISPVAANADAILDVRNKIAALFNDTYASADGEFVVSEPSDITEYNRLMTLLAELKAEAGNDNPTGTSEPLTFTRFYGYNERALFAFDKVFKYNDTYLISFHPTPKTTVIAQIDAKGNLLRERLLNGLVTSVQVVNNNLLITHALDATQCKGIGEAVVNDSFIVGCVAPAATNAIIELDSELNRNSGMQYMNTYSEGFNKLISLPNNELLWINTLEDGTQINWVNGTDRSLVRRVKVAEVAIKVLQHNSTDFSLITKNKKVIRFSINTSTKAITVTDTKLVSESSIVEITDAVIANDKVLLTVKLANGKFGLAQINGTAITVVKNDTIFDSAIYLSNKTLADNSVIAYNEKYLFVFNTSLNLARLIERGNSADKASIINIQNEPSENKILMLSSKQNEKGIYFSLFNDQFDNCSLYPKETVSVVTSTSALTDSTATHTDLGSTVKLEYTRGTKSSNLLTINAVICSAGGDSDDDNEVNYRTNIQEIGWLTRESAMHNLTIPGPTAVSEDNQAMEAAIQNTVQPIWRPNSTYCLKFTLTDRVDDKNTTTFDYYYGFKTLGPVGHYPVPDPVAPAGQTVVKNELTDLSKSPLTSLRQYLDYNRSYPNADGSLLLSKPSFYGNEQCKVSLFFKNPYVYHMLKEWDTYDSRAKIDGALNLIIKDPLNDVLIPYPLPTEATPYPKAEKGNTEWVDDNDPRIPLNIQMLKNMIKGSPDLKCTITIGDALKPKSYGYEVKLTDLKPSKLYTVLAKNYFDKNQNGIPNDNENILVHQFGFQTSRYRDFAEQVNSYVLDQAEARKALFDVPLSLSEDQITSLNNVVFGNDDTLSNSLALKYQHLFDRAFEGILKMSPLDPAQSTEVNRIVNTNTGEVVALLVRNPEPFNIPKIPLEEIKNTISVVDDAGVSKAGYKALHSKDYAQVLIMNDSKKITDQNLNIKFEYRMWNNNGSVEAHSTPLTVRAAEPVTLTIENINL